MENGGSNNAPKEEHGDRARCDQTTGDVGDCLNEDWCPNALPHRWTKPTTTNCNCPGILRKSFVVFFACFFREGPLSFRRLPLLHGSDSPGSLVISDMRCRLARHGRNSYLDGSFFSCLCVLRPRFWADGKTRQWLPRGRMAGPTRPALPQEPIAERNARCETLIELLSN